MRSGLPVVQLQLQNSKMAKSLRSKWKQKMRRERREKFKVKETQRLLETLGVSEAGKGEAMAVACEEKDIQDEKKDQQSDHVEPTQSTTDIEMDQEKAQQNNKTSKKKVNRKELLKRLGKKRHLKKRNKKLKW